MSIFCVSALANGFADERRGPTQVQSLHYGTYVQVESTYEQLSNSPCNDL